MDEDIRDLLVDADLFDPFEDEEEPDGGEAAAVAEEQSVIGAPLNQEKPAEEPPRAPEERIAALFEEMPGQKMLLMRLIDHCREQKTGEEMDVFTRELQENCYSVYSPVILRELLQEAGAIDYVLPEDDDDADGAGEAATAAVSAGESEAFAEGRPPAPAAPPAGSAGCAAAEDPFAKGGVLIAVGEENVRHETLVEQGEEVVLDFLEVEEQKPGFWVATAAGCAAVDAVDFVGDTRELLEKEPVYLDIYHQILDFCAQEKYGRSAKELDNLVNDSPLLQEPRRYSGYFVSRLERQGALEWKKGWCITEAGQVALEESRAQVQKEEMAHV